MRLRDGRQLTALEVQRVYLRAGARSSSTTARRDADEQTADVLRRWAEVLDDLSIDPMRCADRLDWPAKLRLLEGYRERDGLGWGDSRLQLVDLQYSDVRPDKGLYHRLVARGSMQRLLTDDEVTPRDGRARRRTPGPSSAGECLRRYPPQVAAASLGLGGLRPRPGEPGAHPDDGAAARHPRARRARCSRRRRRRRSSSTRSPAADPATPSG